MKHLTHDDGERIRCSCGWMSVAGENRHNDKHPPEMPGFTEEQIVWLQAKLDRAHVKERKRAGLRLSYIESWHAISEANRIFGFDAWSRETIEMREVATDKVMIGATETFAGYPGWRVGYISKVRVTVRAGELLIVREGTGYGSGIDRDLGAAHESAAKEAESDAAKRALMTFGNPFGLALYDKTQAQVEDVAEVASPRFRDRSAEGEDLGDFGSTPPNRKQRLGPPPRRRVQAAREKAQPPEPPLMVPNQRLIELASQAANKGTTALRLFWKALDPQELDSIRKVITEELVPIARQIDDQRDIIANMISQ